MCRDMLREPRVQGLARSVCAPARSRGFALPPGWELRRHLNKYVRSLKISPMSVAAKDSGWVE